MQCVAEAVMAKGIRELAEELLPGSKYLRELASEAMERLRERRNREQIREDVRQAAIASMEEARVAAERIAREVARGVADREQASLELYLAQIPGAIRRSLRRPEDHTGTTVPPDLRLQTADDMIRLLPHQLPAFRMGQDLPGRPGWKLAAPLGSGGFGEVWRVDHRYAKPWAVKFCTDPTAKKRLLEHEAELVTRVREDGHPNVVPLLDAVLESDNPWLAYEYIDGGDLTSLILRWQRQAIGDRVKQVEAALKTLAETAGHFHRATRGGKPAPIVHRDLKPANILIKKLEGKAGRLLVTDFGIGGIAASNQLAAPQDSTTVHARAVSMLSGAYTPLYASPQQQRGEPADPRDDVHALGVIGYQMLTGKLDAAPGARFDRELRDLGVPTALIDLLGDCVDTNKQQQPANGLIVAERFRRSGPTPVPPPPPLPDPKPDPEPTGNGKGGKKGSGTKTRGDDDIDMDEVVAKPRGGFAAFLASAMIGTQAVFFICLASVGSVIALTDSKAREPVVGFFVIIALTSFANWYHGRGQPVRRRLRIGTLSWAVLILFGIANANAPSTYVPQPSYSSSYSYGNSFNYDYTRKQQEESYRRSLDSAIAADKSAALARGGVACFVEITLTLWFVLGRPNKSKQQQRSLAWRFGHSLGDVFGRGLGGTLLLLFVIIVCVFLVMALFARA